MPNEPLTEQQLRAENEDLRLRLAHAEEILREMRSGGVDALVVPEMGGAQLFALKDVGQSFRILVEEMSEGALTMTAQGVIVYANRRFAGMLKAPLEKVIGSELRTWIAPDGQPILQSLLEKGAAEERREEVSLAAGDGTRVPVHLSVSNLRINGLPDAYCLVATDLTEHKRSEAIAASEKLAQGLLAAANQSREELLRVIEDKTRAEEALRASRDLLGSVLENVPIRVFWKDLELRYLGCNSLFARDAGMSRPDELVGKDDVQMGWRKQAERYRADDRRVIDTNTPTIGYEEPQTTPDGNEIWLRSSKVPLHGANGKVVGILGIYDDITERKLAEEALKINVQRLDLTVKAGQIGIWDLDLIRDTSWRSLQHDQIFGYETLLPEWGQAIFLRHVVPEDRDRVSRCFEEATRTDELEFECQIIRADQNRRWIHARGQVYRDQTDRPVRILGTVTDITARKVADEAQRLHAVELEESQRIARIGSWAWKIATGVVTWSDGMNHVLARDRALPPPTFETLQQFYTPESWQRLGAAIANTIETGAPYDLELEMIRADGATCWTTTRGEVVRGADGAVVKLRGTVHDITERKAAERRIAYLNRVYAVLSDINTLIVRVHERDELFKEACRIAVEKGGFHIALIAIVDRSTMTIAPVAWAGVDEKFLPLLKDRFSLLEGAPQGNPIMTRAIKEKKTVVINDLESNPDIVFRQRYAETGIRSLAVFPLIVADEAAGVLVLYATESEFFYDEEMKLLTELAGDIAYAIDHIDKQRRLDYLAYYDALTGLANRALFLERVTQYIRSATRGGHKLAVFLIDLERFKNINDSLGRPAGDALLRQVADWLTRDSGDANLVARLDADHFATVLPVVAQEGDGAQILKKTMQAFMDHPFRLNDAVFRIAAKVGVAVFPDDGADADTLFRHAEAALKKAKASGERYLFYTRAMTEAVEGKLSLENQLRQALDNQEFVLHYQPKVNLASGKMTSAEALIRWNDPRTGLVPPGRFIPNLEETGLIYDVGRWALRQAIKDYLRWRAAGLPAVRIAVNVSPLQLRNRGFIDDVRQVIGIDAQAPAGLELEVTESLIMEDVKHSIASLQAIRELGVTIAIDDFGTGFSSLSYLAKLPVHTLKIDRSFVIEMTVAPEGLALVATIITLAHSLKLNVVAEGVETEEQSRLLHLLNCDEMQGFLFCKPVPAEIFEARFLAPPATG